MYFDAQKKSAVILSISNLVQSYYFYKQEANCRVWVATVGRKGIPSVQDTVLDVVVLGSRF